MQFTHITLLDVGTGEQKQAAVCINMVYPTLRIILGHNDQHILPIGSMT